jgi:glycerophosphoryl diester phosphodiesterase
VLGPENRLETFRKAIDLGVDAIEFDIHQSRDGHLVVLHDITLARTYDGHVGRVDQMTLAELQKLGVPTLNRTLKLARGRCRLLVEIKQPPDSRHRGIENRLMQSLREHKMVDDVVVISFDAESLRRMHKLEPRLATGYLTARPTRQEVARELGVTYLAPHFSGIDATFVHQAHAAGFKVGVWTVNDPAALRAMVDAGCDAITTDRPDLLLEALGRVPAVP